MSDTTFRAALVAPARPSFVALRAGVRRFRTVAAAVAETVETYSLIEAGCLLAAMVAGTVFVTASFGFSI